MSLAILGGTFDPIHFGHLRAAENARTALGVDRVLLVPAHVPPHRTGPIASPWDRWAMVALACAGHPGLVPSEIELRREGPSYTVDTVEAVRRDTGESDIVVVVGEDAFAEMASWKDVSRLLSMCRVAVVGRPGTERVGREAGVVHVPSSELPISSTALRERLREGGSVRFLVPDAVCDYIAKRGLYR